METDTPDAAVAEAEERIDHAEEVLAAGWFQVEAIGAAVAGGLIGSSVASAVLGDSTANVVGMMAGEKAYAESRGLTERVLVAVTATHVLVLNADTSERLPHVGASFDRSTCEITAKNFGPVLTLHLTDPADGRKLKLGGSTLGKSDRSVEQVLKS